MTQRAGALTGLMNQPSAQVIDGSLNFLKESTNPYLEFTPGSAGNRKTWTWSGWVKRSVLSTGQNIFGSNSLWFELQFKVTTDQLQIYWETSGTSSNYFISDAIYRDPLAFLHIVLKVDTTQSTQTDRVQVYVNGTIITWSSASYPSLNYATGVNSANAHGIGIRITGPALAFDGQLSNVYLIDGQALGPEYFGFTDPLTNTWRPKKFSGNFVINPDGFGVRYSNFGSGTVNATRTYDKAFDGSTSTFCEPADNQTITFDFTSLPGGGIAVSSSLRMYLNKAGTPAAGHFTVNGTNLGGSVPSGAYLTIGSVSRLDTITFYHASGSSSVELYAVEVDGTILIDFEGTNSFYLPMDGNSPIGQDKSGQGNDFTPVNFSGTFNDPDVLKDSPSGAVSGGPPTSGITTTSSAPSNYATFNVLRERTAGYNPSFSDGNLFMDGRGDGTGTLSASSGKFYFEVLVDTVGSSGQIYLGVQDAAYSGQERGWSTAQIAAMRDTNALYGNGNTGSGATYGAGDLISFAFDADNNKLYIAKNGVYMNSGNPSQGTGFTHSGISFVGGYTPIVSDSQTGQKFGLNCGQKPFKYAPPDGFQPLNAANVRPETVITRPDQFVGVTTYSGTGSTQSISGLGFKPDFVWLKRRDGAGNNNIQDSVRGAEYFIQSDDAMAQTNSGSRLSSFDDDGFTLTSDNGGNTSSGTYVAWTWRAGGNKNTFNVDDVGYASAAAAGLDGGTITPTGASVGTKQGFSIIKYTGTGATATVPHGLNNAPSFILTKTLGVAVQWVVYHSATGKDKYLGLNRTESAQTESSYWGAGVTSTTFGLQNAAGGNNNGNMIAYCWQDVPGLQKFGQFTANASGNGPFVELGFRPSILWVKASSSAGDMSYASWLIVDGERSPTNAVKKALWANKSAAEGKRGNGSDSYTDAWLDILSNGFKIRYDGTDVNGTSGQTYIYCAWAEAPASNLFGGSSNAR